MLSVLKFIQYSNKIKINNYFSKFNIACTSKEKIAKIEFSNLQWRMSKKKYLLVKRSFQSSYQLKQKRKERGRKGHIQLNSVI
jgi:hypothetical protein